MSGDRRSVERLLVRYARAIDESRYDWLDEVFTEDAALDFSEVGGLRGTYREVRPWLEETLAKYESLHHQLGNVDIQVRGAEGTAHSYVRAMHVYREDGEKHHFELGAVYEDVIELTDHGFRIAKRTLRKRFIVGRMPTGRG